MKHSVVLLAAAFLTGCAGSVTSQAPLPLRIAPQALALAPQALRSKGDANCSAAPFGSGLLVDGDFSQAPYPGGHQTFKHGQTFAPDWVVTQRNIDFAGSDFRSPGGLCTVDLDGTTNHGHSVGAVAHAPVALTIGQSYRLGFLFSGNGCSPGPVVKTMIVAVMGAYKKFTWNSANGHNAENGFFQHETWTFKATATSTGMSFRSLDKLPSNCGPVIGALTLSPKTL